MGKPQLDGLALALGMGARYLQSQAVALAQKLPEAIDRAAAELHPALGKGAEAFAAKLVAGVKSITPATARRVVVLPAPLWPMKP